MQKEPVLFGDWFERVMDFTGVKPAVEQVADALQTDCGCTKRKEALNAIHSKGKQYLNSYQRRLLRKQQPD